MKTFIVLFVLCLPLTTWAKLNVVTTTTDLAALAYAIGGEHVQVKSLCRGDQDPHYLEAKPSYARTMNRADLLIAVGLDLEIGWLPVLLTQSRNPKIQRGTRGYLDASQGLSIREIPVGRIDRSQGDIHPLGNPHYWLDPRNGLKIAARLAERFAALDHEHAAGYQHNLQRLRDRMHAKLNIWMQRLMPLRSTHLITNHKTFSYFAHWSGIKVVDVIEPKPGIPPSPAHIMKLIELAKRKSIAALMIANYSNPKAAVELSKRTEVPLLRVPSSVSDYQAESAYVELFEQLVTQLEALK